MEMAESYLQQGPTSSSSADRYQVLVHVTAETPQPNTAFIEDGPHGSAETSRRIACDTCISRLLENEKVEPISIGRKSRVIPPPMRRAESFTVQALRWRFIWRTLPIDCEKHLKSSTLIRKPASPDGVEKRWIKHSRLNTYGESITQNNSKS
jgi:hypothetical protein